ncbi:MAG: hypothetical protein NTY03_05310 [Candidatus Bathyarchaeota archaeon]|jgi:hypothetical protein|nr:hypothetical protein [Candidatus Bathyarchaeota archaeon]
MMNSEQLGHISYDENQFVRPNSRTVFSEVLGYLPKDLLTDVTILLQDSGYVSIKPIRLARADWYRFDRSVKKIGGVWVSNTRFSHWSIPLTRLH